MAGLTRETIDRSAGFDRAERERLLAPLLESVDALAVKGATAIRTELPGYGGQTDQFYEDVLDQLRRNYSVLLQALISGRRYSREDLAHQRGASMRRARMGLALEDYLSAYRVGQQVLWEEIVARAEEADVDHRIVLRLTSEFMRLIDHSTTNAAHAYVEFRQYGLADAARERRDLLEHLLAGTMPERGPLLTAAERYGLAADTPALVAVGLGVGAATAEDGFELAGSSLARAQLHDVATLVVVRHSEIVAIIPLGPDRSPDRACQRLEAAQERLRGERLPLAIGVSAIAENVAGLPEAYREAQAAVRFVGKDGGITALPRLTPFEYLALTADHTARRLIDPRLQTFLRADRRRGGLLVATVRAYAETNLSLKDAAARLHVHPNTAQYRFQRIEELTGLSPRRFEDLHKLLVAIALDDATLAPS